MKVLVFPKDKNPYQELLYNSLQEQYHNIEIKYFNYNYHSNVWLNYILIPLFLIKERLSGYRIFHLHWLYNFSFTHRNPFLNQLHKFFLVYYILFFFILVKILGFKLVWTVHNVLPHEKQTTNDILYTRVIAYLCDAKIVHSQTTIHQLRKIKISTKKISVVPFGNFAKVYKNEIIKTEAKNHFNIDKNTFVFLFFGFIRKYKGVEDLLLAFTEIIKTHPNAALLIAGQSLDYKITAAINDSLQLLPNNIKPFIHSIEDNEIQYFFNAADIVVYPFNKVTTSSSVFLAFQYKKPIIYPKLGNLKDLPNNIGYSYDIEDKHGLYKGMMQALKESKYLQEIGMKGYNYSNTLSWKSAALKTYEIYIEISTN